MIDATTNRWKLLARQEQQLGPDHIELAPILDDLSYSYHSEKQFEQAESCYRRALAIREKHFGAKSPELLCNLHCLGFLLRIREKYQEAESLYQRALEITNVRWGNQSIEAAKHQNYLSGLYFAWRRYSEARDLVRSSRHIYKLQLGEKDQTVGMAYIAEALLLKDLGENEESTEALKMSWQSLGSEPDASVSANLSRFSRKLLQSGAYEDADQVFRYSLILQAEEIWPHHPLIAEAISDLAKMYRQDGMLEAAVYLYQSAMEIDEQLKQSDKPSYIESANDLAATLIDLNRLTEAQNLLQMLDTKIRRVPDLSGDLLQSVRNTRIRLLKGQSRKSTEGTG